MLTRLACCGVLSVLLVSPSPSQEPAAYSRPPGDTLHYHENTVSVTELRMPQGRVPVSSEHDAQLALAFGSADSVVAWYEALSLRAETPQGAQSPSTAEALGKPFVFRLNAKGETIILSAPTFPSSFRGFTDLSRQFDDFFLRLPDGALRPGVEWSDTSVDLHSDDAGLRTRIRRVVTSRVVGDSVFAGQPVLVIATTTTQQFTTEGPGPAPGLSLQSELTGTEEGRVLWSVNRGVLVRRDREATLTGELQYLGGPQVLRVPVHRQYRSTLELRP